MGHSQALAATLDDVTALINQTQSSPNKAQTLAITLDDVTSLINQDGPPIISLGGGGFLPQRSYQYRYKTEERLDAIAPEVAQVIKAEAIAHIDNAKAVQVKTALKSLGIDYKKAYQQIYLDLVQEMRDEEEQIVTAIALMI